VVAVTGIGLIEILQLWAPGRHARLEDFVVDALAACVGIAVAAGLDWIIQRSRRSGAGAS
jgi:VanZ family protein